MHAIDQQFAMAGFLVGALVGMTGVGGGSLMTPILILLFGAGHGCRHGPLVRSSYQNRRQFSAWVQP
jgi:uncharacterized membrane protein YfcA